MKNIKHVVEKSLIKSVRSSSSYSVNRYVGASVWISVYNTVWLALRIPVRDRVYNIVWVALSNSVLASVFK